MLYSRQFALAARNRDRVIYGYSHCDTIRDRISSCVSSWNRATRSSPPTREIIHFGTKFQKIENRIDGSIERIVYVSVFFLFLFFSKFSYVRIIFPGRAIREKSESCEWEESRWLSEELALGERKREREGERNWNVRLIRSALAALNSFPDSKVRTCNSMKSPFKTPARPGNELERSAVFPRPRTLPSSSSTSFSPSSRKLSSEKREKT